MSFALSTPQWSLACPDWKERLKEGRSLMPDLPWLDHSRAKRATAVFDKLKLADVPGNPALREACGPWFRDIVGALHGSLLGTERWIREVFVLVPKKNSKTSYGAGLMLTSLLLNQRPKATFLLVAPTHDITEIAFSQVEGMIALDEYLVERIHVQRHLKKVTDRRTGATLEVMTFDPSVLTGQKAAGILLDELHVVGSVAKAPSAIGQLRGGMIAYPEAFFFIITTQSDKPPAGVFRAELNKARAIRDGRAHGRMLPILYEFPEEMQKDREQPWRNAQNWPQVTPNNGRSITVERLIEDFAEAQIAGEDEIRRWASQHLNIEIGVALMSDSWTGAHYWSDRAEPQITPESLIRDCDVICCGVDGGGLDDLLSLALVGRDATTRHWYFWQHSWAHRTVLERRKQEAGRLLDFEKTGELTIVDALPDDIDQLVSIIVKVRDAGKLAQVGLDPAGIGGIVDALAEQKIAGDEQIVGISQGWTLANAIKTVERKLVDGTFWHAGQRIMDWVVGNAKVEPRGNAIMITKQAAGYGKIDPLMALFDAVQLMSRDPQPFNAPSKYEKTGLLVL